MCPTLYPLVAPLNRPSVTRATSCPRPAPATAAVTASISGIPGEPFGPSYRITTTSPGTTAPLVTASNAAASESNGRGRPRKSSDAAPATLMTLPSGSVGADIGWPTVPSGAGGDSDARFAATVSPVTVRHEP